jgi:hypothetical protein
MTSLNNECHSDEMTSWHTGIMMKWQYDKMTGHQKNANLANFSQTLKLPRSISSSKKCQVEFNKLI